MYVIPIVCHYLIVNVSKIVLQTAWLSMCLYVFPCVIITDTSPLTVQTPYRFEEYNANNLF